MPPATSQPQPPFAPDPAQAAAIIDAACNPYLSLHDIAESHNITLEQLTLFLDRPDIRERLAHIDTVTSRRTQSIAAACLPAVVKSLNRIVEAYLWEESRTVVTPTNFSQLEQRRRAAETTRRAGALLYRLSKPPTPPRPPRPDAPPRPPRTSAPTARKDPGIPSLGPAPSDSEPVAPTTSAARESTAPTPASTNEPTAPDSPPSASPDPADLPAPPPEPTSPPSDPDAVLLAQLAAGRRFAARILHQLTGPAP